MNRMMGNTHPANERIGEYLRLLKTSTSGL